MSGLSLQMRCSFFTLSVVGAKMFENKDMTHLDNPAHLNNEQKGDISKKKKWAQRLQRLGKGGLGIVGGAGMAGVGIAGFQSEQEKKMPKWVKPSPEVKARWNTEVEKVEQHNEMVKKWPTVMTDEKIKIPQSESGGESILKPIFNKDSNCGLPAGFISKDGESCFYGRADMTIARHLQNAKWEAQQDESKLLQAFSQENNLGHLSTLDLMDRMAEGNVATSVEVPVESLTLKTANGDQFTVKFLLNGKPLKMGSKVYPAGLEVCIDDGKGGKQSFSWRGDDRTFPKGFVSKNGYESDDLRVLTCDDLANYDSLADELAPQFGLVEGSHEWEKQDVPLEPGLEQYVPIESPSELGDNLATIFWVLLAVAGFVILILAFLYLVGACDSGKEEK